MKIQLLTLATGLLLLSQAFAQKKWHYTAPMGSQRNLHCVVSVPGGKVMALGGYDGSGATATAEIYDVSTDTWKAADTMSVEREEFTATLLKNGKIFVAGGYSNSATLSSTEIYDPATDTWSAGPDMSSARSQHTATLLDNGKVLLTGGNTGAAFAGITLVELYDPADNSITTISGMATGRFNHTATKLNDGNVIVACGVDGSGYRDQSAEVFSPETGNWTTVGTLMGSYRDRLSSVLLPDGKVYFSPGSYFNSGNVVGYYVDDIFDPAAFYAGNNPWTSTGGFPYASDNRFAAEAYVVDNKNLFVTVGINNGGSNGFGPYSMANTLVYDLVGSEGWRAIPGSTMNDESYMRAYAKGIQINSGSILLTGGAFNNTAEMYTTVFPLVLEARNWAPKASMNEIRRNHIAVPLSKTKALVAGGYNGNEILASAEIYDITSDTWTYTGDMATARSGFTANPLSGGKTIVFGGIDPNNNNLESTEIFDSVSGLWSTGPQMSVKRSGHTSTLMANGNVIIIGGYDGSSTNSAVVEIYDPAANTITVVSPLNQGRSYHSATLLQNGKVFVSGGFDAGFRKQNGEIYDPSTDTWTLATGMITYRRYGNSTLLPSGKVLITGGSYYDGGTSAEYGWIFNEIFDPEAFDNAMNPWSSVVDFPSNAQGRFEHEAYVVHEDTVLILPGTGVTDNTGSSVTSQAMLYSISANTLTPKPMLYDNVRFRSKSVQLGSTVLVTGGTNASVEAYMVTTVTSISVPTVTSINAGKITTSVSAYPNPTYGKLTIGLENASAPASSVSLYTLSGSEVKTISKVSAKPTIDISELQPAIYLLKVTTKDGTYWKKILKE